MKQRAIWLALVCLKLGAIVIGALITVELMYR